jgi:signal transduction histidine kinase
MAQTEKEDQRLMETIQKYSALYQDQSVPYALTGPDLKIQWMNDAFQGLFPKPETVKRFFGLIGENYSHEIISTLKKGIVLHYDFFIIKDKSFGITMIPIQQKNKKKLIGTVFVLEQNTARPYPFQNQSEDILGKFAYGLREPIASAISGLIKIHQNQCQPAKGETKKSLERKKALENDLQRIIDDEFKLLRLTDNCTHIMQAENKIERYKKSFVNIAAVLDDLCKILEETAKEKGISFAYTIPRQLIASCQIGLIKNAILHLAANAFFFSEGRSVELKAEDLEGRLRIILTDKGCGIPEENQEKIFDLFFSYNPRTGMPYSNGLGLTIAKKEIEAAGGILSVTSDINSGTTVSFEIPYFHSGASFLKDDSLGSYFKDTFSEYRIQMLPVIGAPRLSDLQKTDVMSNK